MNGNNVAHGPLEVREIADATSRLRARILFFERGEVSMSNKALSSEDDEGTASLPLARDLELDQIRKAVKGIRFGEVRVIIQDGHIVQIERVEKQRIR